MSAASRVLSQQRRSTVYSSFIELSEQRRPTVFLSFHRSAHAAAFSQSPYMKSLCYCLLFSPNWQALLASRRLCRRRPFLFFGSLFLLFRFLSVSTPDSCALDSSAIDLPRWRPGEHAQVLKSFSLSLLQRFEVILGSTVPRFLMLLWFFGSLQFLG